ncbi:hypothetical protein CONPUDRAFT_146310 [Coniophora puteana RWD-64-598 SS2]|uniref:Transmembrane protein n=1 Tax=Coniophora puteana (strain RWD-64-598) TaxID=741705 RepID=A0A5M3MFF4_CONPW|nr:uncharacterized protein CONPUDRAFT_146310 [Coniophora puteana RWD-64-598 SS2]EIW77321.1 hypothetical protein CONPUDRAFT_146310 [Coniophora puteana RWD-64-598 SS2]
MAHSTSASSISHVTAVPGTQCSASFTHDLEVQTIVGAHRSIHILPSNPAATTVYGTWGPASNQPASGPSTGVDGNRESRTIAGTRTLERVLDLTSARFITHPRTLSASSRPYNYSSLLTTEEDDNDDDASDTLGPPPPPYSPSDAELPDYTSEDPNAPLRVTGTLAEHLFKFGFFFFPLWIVGTVILFSPLSAPDDFEPGKTEAERQHIIDTIRDAELIWARRSACAVFALLVLVTSVAAIYVGIVYL